MDVSSTLTGERIRASIDAESIPHIMSVLTDLYENPELAVIREYSTNALDANIEAGNPDPIKVTTPTALSPFLRIEDAGVGMNAETIRDVYSKYGTSTKRESNDVVGMLGLGCKSALTYTDQFSVASVLDEVRTLVSVSRDEDGGVSFTIVEVTNTSEPNGTEVIIPAKRDNTMQAAAEDFFRFWKPGTVLLNGKEPRQIEGMWVNDKILLSTEVRSSMIVMGNVPYPAEALRINSLPWGTHIVAYVDIGTVQFTPSREALQDTKQVRDRIAEVKGDVEALMEASFKAQIEAADSPPEFIARYLDAVRHGYRRPLQRPHDHPAYEDENGLKHRLPDKWGFRPGSSGNRFLSVPFQKIYRKKDGEWIPHLNLDSVSSSLFFTGFDAAAFSPSKREKLEVWKAKQDFGEWQPARFFFTDHLALGERMWLHDRQIRDWSEVDSIKIERKKDGTAKPRGAYKGKQAGGTWFSTFQADTIDTTKPIYWNHGNEWTTRGHVAIRLGAIREDATIVALSENRIAKFKRDFPKAKSLDEAWQEYLKNVWKSFTKDDLLALELDMWDKKLLTRLPLSQIDDPDVRRWIKLANRKVDTNLVTTYTNFARYAPPTTAEDNPLDKYPLLHRDYRDSTTTIEHAILYINAAYAAEKETQS